MRLAGAGRPVKDDAARRIDAEMAVDVRVFERQLHQLAHQLDLLVEAADVLEGDVEGAVRNMLVVIVEHHLGLFVDDAGPLRHLVDLVGGAGMGIRERDVEHRAGAGGRAALDQDFLQVRDQIMRHRDIDRRQQLDALDRADRRGLDLDRFIEMRLEGLAHEPVEPHDAGAGIGLERRIEPRQHAAAAFGGEAHHRVGRDPELAHQDAVQPDAEPGAGARRTGQMVDARMHMHAPAMDMGLGAGVRIGVHG